MITKNSLYNKNVLICTSLIGFISGFLIDDVNYFQNKKYNVFCCANSDHKGSETGKKVVTELGVQFIEAPFSSSNPFSKSNIKAYLVLKKLFKNTKFDLIIVHTPISGFICRLAYKKYFKKGAPIIYVTHGFAFSGNNFSKKMKIFYLAEKLASNWCSLILTVNKEDFDYARGFKTCDVKYIPGYGVNIEKFLKSSVDKKTFIKTIGLGNDDIVLTSIGELSPRKNHIAVLRGIDKSKYKSKIVYLIAGRTIHDISTETSLIDYAKKHNIRLKLLGFCSNVEDYLHITDIGILPSLIEGFGFAGIETIASGVPLIGNSTKGIKDYVVDGENGYLIDINDDFKLSSTIDSLIDNPIKLNKQHIYKFSKENALRERFEIFNEFTDIQK